MRKAQSVLVLMLIAVAACGCASKQMKEPGTDTFQIPQSDYEGETNDTSFWQATSPVLAYGHMQPVSSQTNSDLVIGSWNIKWFGNRDPQKYDYVTMADFFEECDVIAVQEITGENYKECLDLLLQEINHRGHNYTYKESNETGYDTSNPDPDKNQYLERFAFFWDQDRVEMKSGSFVFRAHFPRIRNLPFPSFCDANDIGAPVFPSERARGHFPKHFIGKGEASWFCLPARSLVDQARVVAADQAS